MKLLRDFLKHGFIAVVFIIVFVALFAIADTYFAVFGLLAAYLIFLVFTSLFKSIFVNVFQFFVVGIPSFCLIGEIETRLDNFLYVNLGRYGSLLAGMLICVFIVVAFKLLLDKIFIMFRCEQSNSYMNEFYTEMRQKFSHEK